MQSRTTETVTVKGGQRELDVVMAALTDLGLDPFALTRVTIEPTQRSGKPGVTIKAEQLVRKPAEGGACND